MGMNEFEIGSKNYYNYYYYLFEDRFFFDFQPPGVSSYSSSITTVTYDYLWRYYILWLVLEKLRSLG